MTPRQAVLAGVIACLLTIVLVGVARRLALRSGITDLPQAGKAHAAPIPKLGGVAIAAALVFTGLLFPAWSRASTAVAVGALLVCAVGLIDDLRSLPPVPRLTVEVAAAGLAAASGAHFELLDGRLGNAAEIGVTVAWIVVVTNSFNLLDNMDGAAASVGAVIGVGLFTAAAWQHQSVALGLAALLVGGSLGFLVHNWSPARIFMGDAGSLLIGYLLVVTALRLRFPVSHVAAGGAVLLFLAPALFDTTLVVISRIRARRPFFVGGLDHTAHRLRRLGLSVREVTLVLAAASSVCAWLAVAVGRGSVSPAVVIPVCGVTSAVMLLLLLRLPVYEHQMRHFAPRRSTLRPPALPIERDLSAETSPLRTDELA